MAKEFSLSTEDEIRTRAYQIYLEHGCQPGQDLDNWLQAKYEVMQLPSHKHPELELLPPKKSSGK